MRPPARRLAQSAAAAALTVATLLPAACADPRPTEPTVALQAAQGAAHAGGAAVRTVLMKDACDPLTFDAALQDPNACARQGGMKFDQFISEVAKHQEAGAWHFSPSSMQVKVGQTLIAVNTGGEVHTFTEVEQFGGGIVDTLNVLSGNTVPAPECLALEPDDFVPPGGTYTDEVEEPGTELYQCCIHPWMRLVRTAK